MADEREPEINKLFRLARKYQASELELEADASPSLTVSGVRQKMEIRPLSQPNLQQLLLPILHPEQKHRLDAGEDIHFDYALEEDTIFRVTVSAKTSNIKLIAQLIKRMK